MTRRSLATALAVAAAVFSVACSSAKEEPQTTPTPVVPLPPVFDICKDLPEVTMQRCLNESWIVAEAQKLIPACGDRLIDKCYDLFLEANNADVLNNAACNDYWKPCLTSPPCDVHSATPTICHKVVPNLFPTYLRADSYFSPNLIGLTCLSLLTPGRPQFASGGSLKEELLEMLNSRTLPPYDVSASSNPLEVNRETSMVQSASLPAAPPAAAKPGLRSLIGPRRWDDFCGAPIVYREDHYTPNERFFDPFFYEKADLEGMTSCTWYAVQKYYDWAVFQMRMQSDENSFAAVPAILKVQAAYDTNPGARGNLGTLALAGGPISRSYGPGHAAVGHNPEFVLFKGTSRPRNLFEELFGSVRSRTDAAAPQNHLHRMLFTSTALASKTAPCPAGSICFTPTVTENWAWHQAKYQAYVEAEIRPGTETLFKLKRQQLLELLARRAQLEIAIGLAGKPVAQLAIDAIWEPASEPIMQAARILSLQRGELRPQLETITEEERTFLRAQFARDFKTVVERVKAMDETELEKRLEVVDQMLEDALLKNFADCVGTGPSRETPSPLCEWLPEMFTDRFLTVAEADLLDLPPAVAGSDHPLQGPESDKRRCESYTGGISFWSLGNTKLSCPMNSDKSVDNTRFDICGCERVTPPTGATYWRCGNGLTTNSGSEIYPLFYPTKNYRENPLALELYFTRADEMAAAAFQVAKSFIPSCSPTPTMTEVHSGAMQFGNGTFGIRMPQDYLWSKDGRTDQSDLKANFSLNATFLGASKEFLALDAQSEKGWQTQPTAYATVRVLGIDVPWDDVHGSLSKPFGDVSGSFYFSIGPIPCSVRYGAGGNWSAETTVSAASNISVTAKAGARASVFVEGGVDLGIAGAGVGVSLTLFDIRPNYVSTLGMRTTEPGFGVVSEPVTLVFNSQFTVDTNLLSGRFYAWAEVGPCPFCEEFSTTLFDWSGFHQRTPVWDRRFSVRDTSLDELQGWSRPDTCN